MPAQTDDKVWFDTQRKFAGICADIKELTSQSTNVLVLAHFPSTLNYVQQSLRASFITYESFSVADSSLLCSANSGGKVWTGLASAFLPTTSQIGTNSQTNSLQIVVAEHHPISGKDRSLVDSAERLSCGPLISFHISLDDPLMKHFAGDKLTTMMKRMGADENDPISHPFVTNAIQNAQEKIEKQVPRAVATESMDDWFRFNLKT